LLVVTIRFVKLNTLPGGFKKPKKSQSLASVLSS
jgi:hypothetical protein